jgi:predicted  nucleic acid-binding Zn-ribbon protein
MRKTELENIESRIEKLSSQVVKIETQVSQINESKELDYQKVLSAIKYLYRYYDDMTKDKELTSKQQ